jgi:hypothetical protein
MAVKKDLIAQFKKTYNGQELLKKHSLDEEGNWRIFGEDPNCDFGGHHHQPELGLVTGRLEDVIEHAVNLDRFWQWGSGGDIRKLGQPVKVDRNANRQRVKNIARIAELEA